MKHSFNRLPLFCAVTCIALLASSAFASGSVPKSVSGIVHKDVDRGAHQLRASGYTLISSDYHNGKGVEYWWGHGSNQCLQAREVDNKYESIKTTSATDCNQYHEDATKNDNAAGIAIAAAAILGVAVLASQSHQRDDKHNDNSKSMAEFDRGYSDGLHHQSYHNYNRTDAYSDGYNQGHIERDENSRHRASGGHHSGYQSYVSVDDLVGARAAGAESDLRARGFIDAGGYKQGDKSFVTWWNPRTRQCVQTKTRNGRIKAIEPINAENCT
jgi:hypothetical protein